MKKVNTVNVNSVDANTAAAIKGFLNVIPKHKGQNDAVWVAFAHAISVMALMFDTLSIQAVTKAIGDEEIKFTAKDAGITFGKDLGIAWNTSFVPLEWLETLVFTESTVDPEPIVLTDKTEPGIQEEAVPQEEVTPTEGASTEETAPKEQVGKGFTKTNTEMVNLIAQYQTTQSDMVFTDIYTEVEGLAVSIASKFYIDKKATFPTIQKDDCIAVAQFAIFKAVQKYDVEKASPFNAWLKQTIKWSLQDEILKKECNNQSKFNNDASYQSLDRELGSGDTATYGDLVAEQYATEADEIFNTVADSLEPKTDLIGDISALLKSFSMRNFEESTIMETVFTTILNSDNPTARAVNKALANAMPHLSSDALRKKKSRAKALFTEFAMENGFHGVNLSQF